MTSPPRNRRVSHLKLESFHKNRTIRMTNSLHFCFNCTTMNILQVSTGVGKGAKDQTRLRIEKMEAEREERRRLMQEVSKQFSKVPFISKKCSQFEKRKLERAAEEERNIAAGNPGDVDFIGLVKKWRQEHANDALPLVSGQSQPKICVSVRKRPISDKERKRKDHDSVTCYHPAVWVHNAKLKVDGITKYLDHSSFCFDYAFNEESSTEDVYRHCTLPLIEFTCSGKGGEQLSLLMVKQVAERRIQ